MPPQHAGDAPASPPPAAAAAATETTSVPLSPAAIVIDDSPPGSSPRAGGRERPAEVTEEGRPEKRPRIESLPSPPASPPPPPSEEAPPSPPPVIWRPGMEGMLGRPLMVTDRPANSPHGGCRAGTSMRPASRHGEVGENRQRVAAAPSMQSVISVSF